MEYMIFGKAEGYDFVVDTETDKIYLLEDENGVLEIDTLADSNAKLLPLESVDERLQNIANKDFENKFRDTTPFLYYVD